MLKYFSVKSFFRFQKEIINSLEKNFLTTLQSHFSLFSGKTHNSISALSQIIIWFKRVFNSCKEIRNC